MKFNKKLLKAKIIKRYKRFFVDVLLNDNSVLTAHLPNTGPILGAWKEGQDCYLMEKDNPKKLSHGLELIHDNGLVGINTQIPNKLVRKLLEERQIDELVDYTNIFAEFSIGDSKLDFKVTGDNIPDCFIEVKNCSGQEEGIAFFPDTKSERACKHVKELINLKKAGNRACLIIVVQREDVVGFKPGKKFDPEYAELFKQAEIEGVEIIIYNCKVDLEGIEIKSRIPVINDIFG